MITLTRTYTPEYPPLAEGYKWVFCNIEMNDETYGFRTNCREELIDEEVAAWLTAKHDDFCCEIYRYMYREANITKLDGETELEAWQRWEAEGCRNVSVVSLPITNTDISEVDDPAQGQEPEQTTSYVTVEKRKWRNTH